jgi:hypothetical protein
MRRFAHVLSSTLLTCQQSCDSIRISAKSWACWCVVVQCASDLLCMRAQCDASRIQIDELQSKLDRGDDAQADVWCWRCAVCV